MKPRIIKICGVWHCAVMGIKTNWIGLGFTPSDAYRDWVRHG